ncbi:MAG: HAMP domain-containing sensor histidine kinase [Pseudomonadota bacterium]
MLKSFSASLSALCYFACAGAEIRVKDNGPDIPEEAQKKIFEPFYTTKNSGEGTGLGLSVTFNIIKRLNGDLHLNTQPGEFTEFTITFPVSSEEQAL